MSVCTANDGELSQKTPGQVLIKYLRYSLLYAVTATYEGLQNIIIKGIFYQ